jgi:hypothetical protein
VETTIMGVALILQMHRFAEATSSNLTTIDGGGSTASACNIAAQLQMAHHDCRARRGYHFGPRSSCPTASRASSSLFLARVLAIRRDELNNGYVPGSLELEFCTTLFIMVSV